MISLVVFQNQRRKDGKSICPENLPVSIWPLRCWCPASGSPAPMNVIPYNRRCSTAPLWRRWMPPGSPAAPAMSCPAARVWLWRWSWACRRRRPSPSPSCPPRPSRPVRPRRTPPAASRRTPPQPPLTPPPRRPPVRAC